MEAICTSICKLLAVLNARPKLNSNTVDIPNLPIASIHKQASNLASSPSRHHAAEYYKVCLLCPHCKLHILHQALMWDPIVIARSCLDHSILQPAIGFCVQVSAAQNNVLSARIYDDKIKRFPSVEIILALSLWCMYLLAVHAQSRI